MASIGLPATTLDMATTPLLPPKRSTRLRAIGLLVLALFAAGYLYTAPVNWLVRHAGGVLGMNLSTFSFSRPFVLGLDLQGGTRLEYEADLSKVPAADRQEAVNGVRDVIERRVNALGVSEPLVQTTQAGDRWRVSAELAGVSNIQDAIDMIGKTPILEFKTEGPTTQRELTADEQAQITKSAADAKINADALLRAAQQPGANFADLAARATSSSTPIPSEFIRGNTGLASLYAQLRNDAATGTVGRVIETPAANYVVRVDERKAVSKEVMGNHLLISYTGAQGGIVTTLTKEQAKAKIDDLKKQATPQNFLDLIKRESVEPDASSTAGFLDWTEENPADLNATRYVPEFSKPYFALPKGQISDVVESPFGFHLILKSDERPVYDVRATVATFKKMTKEDIIPVGDGWTVTKLTGKQLQSARVDFNQQTGAIQVALQFNDEGKALFGEITRANVGKRVGIFIDGTLISAPVVQTEISGGQAVITGSGSLDEAKTLARNLQEGALPVPINLIAQQTIGASLGVDSLQASLKSGLIGFLLVALFMILLYRLPGVVAILALGLYGALTLTVFKMVPVTLTLSGIAGFILSIGIAVDANVLVFERLKEEWRLGKGLSVALEDAFRRAWPSIRDGHMTVLISCVVLYWFSSSVIRGFSLTLAIGVILSLFTAVVTCRVWLRFLASTKLSRFGRLFLQPRDLAKKND